MFITNAEMAANAAGRWWLDGDGYLYRMEGGCFYVFNERDCEWDHTKLSFMGDGPLTYYGAHNAQIVTPRRALELLAAGECLYDQAGAVWVIIDGLLCNWGFTSGMWAAIFLSPSFNGCRHWPDPTTLK